MWRGLTLLLVVILGCQSQRIEINSDTVTVVSFHDGTTIHEVLGLFQEEEPLPSSSIRITYSDHESEVDVGGATPEETADAVVEAERSRLAFLLDQFNADDPREANVYFALVDDGDLLENKGTVQASRLTAHGVMAFDGADIIKSVDAVEIFQEEETASASSKTVNDYTSAASYVPEGGTSSIYTSGTLQKFWMDEDSADAFNSSEDGVEIDTLIKSRSYAECGSSTSSNLPDYYKDTEFGDGSSYRNCSIGTVSADELMEGERYWTWYSFKSFQTSKDPTIYVQFQPSKWCWWVGSCSSSTGAWCMCSRSDMPIEWLITYKYSDAPSVETPWEKN